MFSRSNFGGKFSANKRSATIKNALMSKTAPAVLLLTLGTQVSLAQPNQASAQDIEQVEVTGTLIVRNGYQAPTPVTVVDADQLARTATINIADAMNRLPELAGSVTPQTSAGSVSQGSAGLNNLDLRGLGADRTLVLLDGQRLVGSSFNTSYGNGGAVDVNVIPAGLVQRET